LQRVPAEWFLLLSAPAVSALSSSLSAGPPKEEKKIVKKEKRKKKQIKANLKKQITIFDKRNRKELKIGHNTTRNQKISSLKARNEGEPFFHTSDMEAMTDSSSSIADIERLSR
jgi:hypothetical protein